MEKPTYTTGELARALGVSNETVRGMIKRGEVKANLVGKHLRITAAEYEKQLAWMKPTLETDKGGAL